MSQDIATTIDYTRQTVPPQPETPPQTTVSHSTVPISATTVSEKDTAGGQEKSTDEAAFEQKPQRESLLDILRDASITHAPSRFIERVAHTLTAEARQAEHDSAINARLDQAIALAEIELIDLGDGLDGIAPTIIELNQKGGAGKSPNATSSAVTLAANNDQVIFVVDNNQVLGSTLQYLGIPKTLGVRDSMTVFRDDTTYSHIRRHLGHHPKYKNLYGVDSDPEDKRRNKPIDAIAYYKYGKGLKSACHTLLFDNGNEVVNAQTLVGLELADVLRFVTIPWVNDANRLCKDTMEETRALYPEKVANAIITISACRPDEMNLEYWAKHFNHPKEQICLIPFDPIFRPRVAIVDGEHKEMAWVVNHTQFQKQTYLANLEREILTLKQARKGVEAKKAKNESEDDIIKRMLKFLQDAEIDKAAFEAAVQAEVNRRLNPAS